MLTYEALLEQAKARGLPPTKARGALREYLEVLILKELYKAEEGKKLYFTGGTYLRLVHNLKRFSEDLDFNTESVKKKEFDCIIEKVKIELKRVGAECTAAFKHWGNIYSASLVFPDVEKGYNVVSRYSKKEGIAIKVETNSPKWKIKKQTEVITGFGEMYPCICTDKAALFADKIDALVRKTRARHLYDIIFMLSNKYPIDRDVLSVLGIRRDPLEVIEERIMDFSATELKRQAEALRPFLFEENEADMLINAQTIVPTLLENYKRS